MKGKLWGLLTLLALAALLPAEEEDRPAVGTVRMEVETPLVALTFDDGPRADTTGPLLEGLALREVPATFFLVGERIGGCEKLVARMAAEGHQVGIHTFDHVRVTELSRGDYDLQVGKTRALVADILGAGDYWLRPPYGIVDPSVEQWERGPIILWSVDPEDWKDKDPHRIVGAVADRVEDGDIILMHDIYPTSVEAALDLVDLLLDRGFCFVTVEQLMTLRGVEPKAGELYRSVPSAH